MGNHDQMSPVENSNEPAKNKNPKFKKPGPDRDKPKRNEEGTDHIEDPDQVAEHVSEIDRRENSGDDR